MRFARSLSIALISVFVSVNSHSVEVEQPPFDVPDPAVSENFRILYYAVRDLQKTISDNAIGIGSVVFVGTDGKLTGDTTNFFWDDTNNVLHIGEHGTSFRTDTELEIQDDEAGISLFQTSNPGDTSKETFIVFGGFDAGGNIKKTGSISSEWFSTDASTGTGVLRFNATHAGGGSDDVSVRLFGDDSVTIFGNSDTDRFGNDILGVRGVVVVQAPNSLHLSGDAFINSRFLTHASTAGVNLGHDNSEVLGLIISQGATSGLAFWTHDGSSWDERMRIHTDGNVGIGTLSPEGQLHVLSNSAGTITANTNANEIVVEGSGNSGISILTPNTVKGRIIFGDPENNAAGLITYDHSKSSMSFSVEGTERFIIGPQGFVHVNSGGSAHHDTDLEVSDGGVVGAGTIHRAASATHSSRRIKSNIRQLTSLEKQSAYDDLKIYDPVEFKYMVCFATHPVTGDCLYRVEPSQKLRRGYIFEDAPGSIREDQTESIVIDDRLFNAEVAMQIIIDKVETLEAASFSPGPPAGRGAPTAPTPTLSSMVNDLMTQNKQQQMEMETLKTKNGILENRLQMLELRSR